MSRSDPEPWLSIIGIGEDGLDGLGSASRAALDAAEVVFGGERHLALAGAGDRGRRWPVPFAVDDVLALRGERRVAVLASGDPFWHGAGGTLAACLDPSEWRTFPQPSTFSLAAARLGWRLEETITLGLHAAPVERLRPNLAQGVRMVCLLSNQAAPQDFARWLTAEGFGGSDMWVMEALGGPRERVRRVRADMFDLDDVQAPVAVAIEAGAGPAWPRASGIPDDLFRHDGQITRQPVRALTLSALAPRAGERLWDIGAGSGSIAIEWVLAGGSRASAIAIEARADRAANIRANVGVFGLADQVRVVVGEAPAALEGLSEPDAVFIGGGASAVLTDRLWERMRPGTRFVANAVTLETESLLASLRSALGGTLMRFEIAEARPLGSHHGWVAARPIVQWSVTR